MPINNHTISFPFAHSDMQLAVEYNAAGDPLYIGRARPAATAAAAEWQIAKVTYDAARNVTAIQFADGTNEYTKVWNSRSSGGYVYA
jgi:YD repeat-containing protein